MMDDGAQYLHSLFTRSSKNVVLQTAQGTHFSLKMIEIGLLMQLVVGGGDLDSVITCTSSSFELRVSRVSCAGMIPASNMTTMITALRLSNVCYKCLLVAI